MSAYKTLKRKYPKVVAWEMLLLLCFFSLQSQAQEIVTLEVNQQKSVHLFFNSRVTYCDTGTKDVAYTIAGNMVRLTADKAAFPETSLTIITEDDHLFNYLVLYSRAPRRLSLHAEPKSGKKLMSGTAGLLMASAAPGIVAQAATDAPVAAAAAPTATVTPAVTTAQASLTASTKAVSAPAAQAPQPQAVPPGPMTDAQQLNICKQIVGNWKFRNFSRHQNQADLQLRNIYTIGNYIYFTVYAENSTNKDILIDFVNFQQGDRKGILRRVYREELKKPVFVFNKQDKLGAKGQQYMVYVFEKFSIDRGKKLLIELGEKEGERFFSLPIPARYINKAQALEVAAP